MGASKTKQQLEEAERVLVDWGLKWHATSSVVDRKKKNVRVEIKDVILGGSLAADGKTPQHIHTLHYSHDGTSDEPPPMVLIHGYAQSAAQYYATAPALASAYPGHVYAIDQLGCSLSTRDRWDGGYGDRCDLKKAEAYFVEALEKWRASLGIERMVVCAHSMGGYVSARYCEKYPERVAKLCLLSPVGIPEKPTPDPSKPKPRWRLRLAKVAWGCGYGPFHLARLVGRRLSDRYCNERYADHEWIPKPLLADQLIKNWRHSHISGGGYAHCTLLQPGTSGPVLGAFAREPLCRTLPATVQTVGHVAFVYGDRDWMKISAAEAVSEAVYAASGRRCGIYRVGHAGHPLPVDNPLGLAEAIMRSLDETETALQQQQQHTRPTTIIDCGGQYVEREMAMREAAKVEPATTARG